MTENEYNAALCERVRHLRKRRSLSSKEMAEVLGILADRYRKYESRSPLPPYLWERFALVVGVSISFLATGKHERFGVNELVFDEEADR